MGDLGDRLSRHVDGSASAVTIDEIRATGNPRRLGARHLAIAAAIVAVVGIGGLIATQIGDDADTQVGQDPADRIENADPWSWLDFGVEHPAPEVPDGWKTLENGDHRFSVPGDWDVTDARRTCSGAPGAVFVETANGGSCNPEDPLPDSFVEIDTDGTFSTNGAIADEVLATLTMPGRIRVLQDGPLADTSGWQTITYEGITFAVPTTWPVVDLVASYNETRDESEAITGRSGQLNPDGCGWFRAPQTYLGYSPLAKACPPGNISLEPGEGVWAYVIDPILDLRYTTFASGTVEGMPVAVIDMDLGPIADPLQLLITAGDQQILVSLGVGLDTSVARAVLHSIRPPGADDPTPPVPASTPIASCVDPDRFAMRMGNLGITYDYDPSNSPEHLRDLSTAVVRATLLDVREDEGDGPAGPWVVFRARVDEVVKGSLEVGDEIEISQMFNPADVPFSSIEEHFTAGIDTVLFLDSGPWPGGWAPFLEGFWAGCDDPPASTIGVAPTRWSHDGTLSYLLERTNGPIESTIPIDGAYRADDGSIVVAVTGYDWGYSACRGAYRAEGSIDADDLSITATAVLHGDRSGSCEEVGFTHVLGVVNTSEFAGTTVIDTATGDIVTIEDGIDSLRPGFFLERAPLPDCGFVVSNDRNTDDATTARQCFRDAYNVDQPAEFSTVGFGDEGESGLTVFRILGNHTYEILVEQRPPLRNRGESDGAWRWQRHECDFIHFFDPPDFNIANYPVLNYGGECRQVESE